jgi:hypothetical protein
MSYWKRVEYLKEQLERAQFEGRNLEVRDLELSLKIQEWLRYE